MIYWLVGQCHVTATNREVIRHVISKLKDGYATWRSIPVDRRKEIMRAIIRAHQDNRELYNYVIKGVRYDNEPHSGASAQLSEDR